MKFSKKTIGVLKSFTTISKSIVIRAKEFPDYSGIDAPTVIGVVANTKKVMAFAGIEETFENDLAIYELPRFLTVITTLFKDPDIEFDGRHAKISDGNRSINYALCQPDMILTPPMKWPNIPEFKDGTFALSAAVISDMQAAAAALSADTFRVFGDGSSIRISVSDIKNKSGHMYETTVGSSDRPCDIKFKPECWNFLPGDYRVTVDNNRGNARFDGDGCRYYVAAEKDKA